MLVTATYNVAGLFLALMTALQSYRTALQAIDLDLIYGSTKLQVGEYFVTEGTMEVTYVQAEAGCYRSRSQLFFVTS